MVRASDSGSGDPGSILGRVGVFVSLSKRHLLPKSTGTRHFQHNLILILNSDNGLSINISEGSYKILSGNTRQTILYRNRFIQAQ